jgi:hypothetical protein
VIAVWAVEWRLALTDRRRFVLSALVPFLIVASVATGVADSESSASVYLVVILAFAVLGTAIPLRWDGERGMVRRVVRGGVPAGTYLIARAAAGAAIDVVQLTPALVVAAIVAGGSPGSAAVTFVALALSVWVAGLVGVVVAALSRSLAETGLVAALAVLVFAHVSGAFREPEPGSLMALLEMSSPFHALHTALLDMTVGSTGVGLWATVAWAVLLPGGLVLFGGQLSKSLGSVGRGGLEGV